MRRMNYDRFAKPFNFGEYNNPQGKFVMDAPIVNGLYLFKLTLDGDFVSTGVIDINNKNTASISTMVYDWENDHNIYIQYDKDAKELNCLASDGSGETLKISNETIIYLYKID